MSFKNKIFIFLTIIYYSSHVYSLECLVQMTSNNPEKDVNVQSCEKQCSSLSANNSSVEHCLIVKYAEKQSLTFSCDCQHHCPKAKLSSEFTSLNDELAMLYCCSDSKCNTIEHAASMELPHSTCYRGNVTFQSGTTHLQSVECYGKSCMSEKLVWSSHYTYNCDTDGLCTKYNIPTNSCKEVDGFGNICCCNGRPNCNGQVINPIYPTPLAPMPPANEHPTPDTSALKWPFIGSLMGAVVLSCLILTVTIMLIRHCKYRRDLNHQRAYSYQQLTADLVAEEPELGDAKLIMA